MAAYRSYRPRHTYKKSFRARARSLFLYFWRLATSLNSIIPFRTERRGAVRCANMYHVLRRCKPKTRDFAKKVLEPCLEVGLEHQQNASVVAFIGSSWT
jgi:citrate synthase